MKLNIDAERLLVNGVHYEREEIGYRTKALWVRDGAREAGLCECDFSHLTVGHPHIDLGDVLL